MRQLTPAIWPHRQRARPFNTPTPPTPHSPKKTMTHTSLTSLAALGLTLAGCATAPSHIGAVVPMEGGRYQSSITGGDPASAMKAFTHDAIITCDKTPQKTRMPWESAPPPPKYVVLSQVMTDKDGKQIKSDSKNLDAGIAVGLRYLGLESKDSVRATTIFRCE